MADYPIPENETYRVEVLKSYRILDSEPDPNFDRIVELLADQLEVPIAYVSFIDSDRQWFKANVGLPFPETTRATALCAHILPRTEQLVIPDLSVDPRFADNPFVVGEPKIRFYAGHPIRVPEGVVIGSVCIIDVKPRHDFSEKDRKLLADCAEIILEHLVCWKQAQDNLVQLDSDLNEARRAAKQADKAKSEFLGIVSHELRTPLNPIIGFSALLGEMQNVRAERVREIADMINLAGNRLLRVVDKVMTFTQLSDDMQELDEEKFPVREVVTAVIDQFLPEAEENKIEIIRTENFSGGTVFLRADRTQIEQVLVQILDNAIRYSGNCGRVTIHLETTSDGSFQCIIDDCGPGLTGDVADVLPIDDAPIRPRDDDGLHGVGVGLPVSDKILRLHKGSLTLDTSPEGGVRALISLPAWRVTISHSENSETLKTG